MYRRKITSIDYAMYLKEFVNFRKLKNELLNNVINFIFVLKNNLRF